MTDSSNDALELHRRQVRGTYRSLTLEEELELGKRIEAGDEEARNELVLANLDVVMAIARRYVDTRKTVYLDLVQEGYLALLKAAKKYDWRRGVTFSTFASYSVRKVVSNGASTLTQTVRLPQSALEVQRRIRRLHTEGDGGDFTAESIAEQTGDSVSLVRHLLDYEAYVTPMSIEAGVEGGGSWTIDIADRSTPEPEQSALSADYLERLHQMMRDLPWKQRKVLELRFNLGDGEDRTVADVARLLGVTGSQVVRLQAKALQTLRKKLTDPESA